KGTAAVVMANGAMTSNNKGEKNVRQHMVNHHMVDCILRLPDKLFLTTGIPACIFILSKNRDGKDGIHRKRDHEILFIDTSKMGTMESRKLRVFTDADVQKVTDTYHAWRNNKDCHPELVSGYQQEYQNSDGFCYSATLDEVQKQDYKLTPGIYVGTEEVVDDGILFEDKMEALKAQLQEQFGKGNALQQQILENFDRL
ncbi:MAG TPA: N-6 DNA methylase, partial [Flavobacteriaceae bacterium]